MIIPHTPRAIISFILLLISLTVKSQSVYVNTGRTINNPANTTYALTPNLCDTLKDSVNLTIYTCPVSVQPDPWTDTSYQDIAIDKHDNLWYVTLSGYLYKRKLNDTTTCQYIGDFTADRSVTSALVADSAGNLYAASNLDDYCTIHKYSSSGFSILGTLPKNVYCSGDLFFYEHRLFMTSTDPDQDSSFLYEIALKDPKQSCYYMPLNNLQPYGAFSIMDGAKTRVYVSETHLPNAESSSLVEIDIPGRKILNTLCTYPFLIRGAAYYYELTGDSTQCPYIPDNVVDINSIAHQYLTVHNPASRTIRINTNITAGEVRTAVLYNMTGQRIIEYSTANFPENFDISGIPDGMYMLYITTTNGSRWNEKVLKSTGW